MILPEPMTYEPVKAELHPNMPPLNPKTNFRYIADQSSLNGISMMKPMDLDRQRDEMTIEETLAAIDSSTILN